MLLPVENQIRVNLIGYDEHTLGDADLAHPGQLLPGPDDSQRIVGAAQKGEICLMESEVPQAAELFYSMIRGEIFVKLLLFPQNEPDDRQVSAWIAFSVDKFLAAYRPGS